MHNNLPLLETGVFRTLATHEVPLIIGLLLMLTFLLFLIAFCSAAENAFFSIKEIELLEIETEDTPKSKTISKLLRSPKQLLATILIMINFANVAFIVLTSLTLDMIFNLGDNMLIKFIIEATAVTFIMLVFGEVIPKIYATQNHLSIARKTATPLSWIKYVLTPFAKILIQTSSIIDKRVTKKGHTVSVDELNYAIDITSNKETPEEEKDILKGIVNFGNISIKQIMKPRVDVAALDIDLKFEELLEKVRFWRYSRFPVYEESFDNIKGILFSKDIIPHLNKDNNFEWQKLIRDPFFVPENKKINDLLEEFQDRHIHMAIVVDEFGGTNGVVTMEDVLEEIFGEINDEFDEENLYYSKLDDKTYVFEGKTLLNDFFRILDLDADFLEDIKGENETLGGLLVELNQGVPKKGMEVKIKNLTISIEACDLRMVKRVKVIIQDQE